MIDAVKVCSVLCGLAKERIPELAQVYLEIQPQEVQRPSLLVGVKSWKMQDTSLELVQVNGELLITVFPSEAAAPEEILALRQKTADLFRLGYIRVEGRALKATAQIGGVNQTADQVSVQLTFFDDREEESEPLPVMETIDTKMDLKG